MSCRSSFARFSDPSTLQSSALPRALSDSGDCLGFEAVEGRRPTQAVRTVGERRAVALIATQASASIRTRDLRRPLVGLNRLLDGRIPPGISRVLCEPILLLFPFKREITSDDEAIIAPFQGVSVILVTSENVNHGWRCSRGSIRGMAPEEEQGAAPS